MIHEAGYIYNDLKLDNIVIGDDKTLPNAKHSLYKVRLIDFGMSTKYVNQDGSHHESAKVQRIVKKYGVKEIEFEIGNRFSLNKKMSKYSKFAVSTEEDIPTWTAFVMIKNSKER